MINDFSRELSRDHNMIPISQIWRHALKQESMSDKSCNLMKISIIQSERSNQGKHFNFLDSSVNFMAVCNDEPSKIKSNSRIEEN